MAASAVSHRPVSHSPRAALADFCFISPPLFLPPLCLAVERVRMVKPDNARAIEEHVIRLARSGKLADRIDEDTLKKMLEDVSGQAEAAAGGVKKVKIIRKKRAGESESDDEDF